MTKPKPLTSPIKYPGGKRKLFAEVNRRLPQGSFKYAEPFWGGGSIGVRLAGEGRLVQLVAGEACGPVRAFWEALMSRPVELRAVLGQLEERFQMRRPFDVFQEMRERVNEAQCRCGERGSPLSPEGLGARMLALNKTCMNGLVRFNSRGEFNVPIGRRQDGSYYRFQPDYEHLDRVRAALVGCGFRIYPGWRDALGAKGEGWGIYCDPPYTGGFVDYTAEGWHSDDDIELYQELAISGALGARVILSQPDTEWARDCCASLLKGWQVDRLEVGRPINSDGQGRGPVGELLIWNKPVERVSVFVPDRVTRIFKNLREEPLSGVKADLVLTDDMFDEGPV
jgi:DNA adenine methylase